MEIFTTPLHIEGIVEHGQQLGRKIGFPTANLEVSSLRSSLPSTGVYGGDCLLPDGSCYRTMINVGYRPTVSQDETKLTVEAHLLNFEGDLYGQRIQLKILFRIRDEKKMASLEELRHQLSQDLQHLL
ncbi:MAG: riboflavin kinase [Bacteroidales bacterium]|nr:riboflavin kinase [Bacteroidales bacterium]